jgi:hypothetical protein
MFGWYGAVGVPQALAATVGSPASGGPMGAVAEVRLALVGAFRFGEYEARPAADQLIDRWPSAQTLAGISYPQARLDGS